MTNKDYYNCLLPLRLTDAGPTVVVTTVSALLPNYNRWTHWYEISRLKPSLKRWLRRNKHERQIRPGFWEKVQPKVVRGLNIGLRATSKSTS